MYIGVVDDKTSSGWVAVGKSDRANVGRPVKGGRGKITRTHTETAAATVRKKMEK